MVCDWQPYSAGNHNSIYPALPIGSVHESRRSRQQGFIRLARFRKMMPAKKAQQDWIVWLVILVVAVVLIITIYYLLTGKLMGLKLPGL